VSPDYHANAEDFFRKLNRQVREDHTGVRERNAKREAVWRQSPAMRMASELLQGPFGHEPVGEEEHGLMLLRAQQGFVREPLVQRYLNHLQNSPRPHSNTEWWHALGHQYVVATQFTVANTFAEAVRNHARSVATPPVLLDGRLFNDGRFADIGPREFSYEWMGRIMRAHTYLWHQNTYEAATAAPLVPHIVQPNALPFADMFFSFENAAFISPTDAVMQIEDTEEMIPALSETWWVHISRLAEAGFALVFDRYLSPPADQNLVAQNHIMFEPIPWGARWPQDFEGFDSYKIVGAVLRMMAFMQAPFVDITPLERKLPRPIRREYARAGKEAPLKEVSIITLRARLQEPVYPNGTEPEGEGRKYQHSWWVNGHYRWQWYPSVKQHKLIAIAPYMKQIGKPLLPQIRDVSR